MNMRGISSQVYEKVLVEELGRRPPHICIPGLQQNHFTSEFACLILKAGHEINAPTQFLFFFVGKAKLFADLKLQLFVYIFCREE